MSEDRMVEVADRSYGDGYDIGQFEGVQLHAEAVLERESDQRGSAERFEVLAQWARRQSMRLHDCADETEQRQRGER